MWVLYEGRDRHTWSLSSGPAGENPADSHMEVKFNTPYGESRRAVLLVLRRPTENPSKTHPRG
ncbi:hypothetical protein CEP54_003793 [Fusarium duplospermum]|uniref:Uncharacterized protein n=1 Tax=Fusarium duplospermum TaxID=1325734 RepID=A0A428QM26_9HYPO|nr:hypothetical protein CEP54_003793 [Fusarium duplospermum]